MQFDIARFFSLIRRDFIIYKKPVFLGTALIVVFMVLLTGWNLYADEAYADAFLMSWFVTCMIVGGLLFTSIIFWEFRTSAGRLQYLSLPASNFEKVASRWLYTILGYPLFIALLFCLLYAISHSLSDFNTGWESVILKETFMGYWIVHPIVFMFSIWYNKYVAPKAVLTSLAFLLLVLFFFYIGHRLFFHELYEGYGITQNFRVDPNADFKLFVEDKVEGIAKFLGLVVLPMFFWVVSYFKMKEKEA